MPILNGGDALSAERASAANRAALPTAAGTYVLSDSNATQQLLTDAT